MLGKDEDDVLLLAEASDVDGGVADGGLDHLGVVL